MGSGKRSQYVTRLADASLDIGAITVDARNPYLWASGTFNPIYNDNRRGLSSPAIRKVVTAAAKAFIREHHVQADFVAGTTTAGIAPATSIADALGVPLLILNEGVAYKIPHVHRPGVRSIADAIASTCPWAIPTGVRVANASDLPFMYVRREAKSHGTRQVIEGLPIAGQSVDFFDYHRGDSYALSAMVALSEKEVSVKRSTIVDHTHFIQPETVKGKSVLVIEDLISTGGSSVREVKGYQELGANVPVCLSIFNYGLPAAEKVFAAANIQMASLLWYDQLLRRAIARGMIPPADVAMLREWREDQPNWGEKHGFPPVRKEK